MRLTSRKSWSQIQFARMDLLSKLYKNPMMRSKKKLKKKTQRSTITALAPRF
eukprot:CAMPEP_0176404302 /NCGR_PEP_ID=MMETSP0126-20121128/50755_1 /TAXON_ID=141414 ORGANISM="Strombidinopsis acuminatum, Strain SPMC142" /NCGR_SAMPLE_ID=MMETSP0126 /ASSEMBLY_ACC=CAM_ASM_000229 /LENGTH=51 /DNA_ID=CAMNT_0017783009 /DNA_START=1387 /DNA_END=1542 /DNA_ORIENTATION=-